MKDLNFSSLFRRGLWLSGLFAMYSASVANAAMGETTLNFVYQISAAPCVVQTSDVDVKLDDMYTTDFTAAGNNGYGGQWKAFSITVGNCPDQTDKVRVTFSGTPSAGDGTKFYHSSGTATNVDVEIQSAETDQNLGNNQTWVQDIDPTTKGTVINLKARAHALSAGNVSPGTIQSAVLATFSYE